MLDDAVASRAAGRTLADARHARISSASSRHGPAVIIRTSATSSCGSAIARSALLEVADLGRLEQAQPADDGVRDVLVAQPGDDRLAVLVLAVQDRDVAASVAVSPTSRLDGVDDGDRLVLRSGADDGARPASPSARSVHEALVGLEAGQRSRPMSRFAAVRTCRTERKFCSSRRRVGGPGGGAVRVVRRRRGEPALELGEGGEAGAAESVDRLVVVADDHDVVGPVRRPAEQLDELDLGDVGVLELVDQDVAELALLAAQDVGPGLEQLRDGGDLLAEVERAAPRELLLVGVVDSGELGQAQDLERRAVDDVGRGEGVDARRGPPGELAPAHGPGRRRRSAGGPRGRPSCSTASGS